MMLIVDKDTLAQVIRINWQWLDLIPWKRFIRMTPELLEIWCGKRYDIGLCAHQNSSKPDKLFASHNDSAFLPLPVSVSKAIIELVTRY